MLWMLLGAGLAIGAMVGYTRWRALRREKPETLWKRLARLTSDMAVAQRLFTKERERFPALSEMAILRRVIRRLERDKKR